MSSVKSLSKRTLAAIIAVALVILAIVGAFAAPKFKKIALSTSGSAPLSQPVTSTATSSTQPKVSWSPSRISVVVPIGSTSSTTASFTSTNTLENVSVTAVPEIAQFIKLDPNSFATVPANQAQNVLLSLSVPQSAKPGTVEGTIHIQDGSRTLPQTLKVTVIAANGVSFVVPPLFAPNASVISLGGPIALNTFNNAYQQGGIIPPGGADIDITSVPLPGSLQSYIADELTGSIITGTNAIVVAGSSSTEVFYTDSFGGLTYKNVAVFVPRSALLYKLYLSYHAGDTSESQFLASFEQILNTIQFTE